MRPFRELLGIFSAVSGYRYVPRDLRHRLMQINGVFCRSKSADAGLVFGMIFLVALGAIGASGLAKAAWRHGFSMDVWLPIAFLQALLVTILGIVWGRFNTKYRIGSGHVTALTRSGKERWSESIAAIEAVAIVKRRLRSDRWLYLEWPGKSRHIELFDALAKELNA